MGSGPEARREPTKVRMPPARSPGVTSRPQRAVPVGTPLCHVRLLGAALGVSGPALEQITRVATALGPFVRGDHLFSPGEDFDALYAICRGSVKVYINTPQGDEQVIGFRLAGDLTGLDGVVTGCHSSGAIALEPTVVCRLPFLELEALASGVPALQHRILGVLSNEVLRGEDIITVLGKKKADQRLAGFLLDFAERWAVRYRHGDRFPLVMSRTDIANHLGLAQETISRLFGSFRDQGLLSIHGRLVHIEDKASLRRLAGTPFYCRSPEARGGEGASVPS